MESVTEESIVGIKNEVDHFICSRNIEAVTEPIDTHISRKHGVKHEILKVGQVLSGEEVCFVHEPIIGTRVGGLGVALCHSLNWFFYFTFHSYLSTIE